jgi:hypothetical protein
MEENMFDFLLVVTALMVGYFVSWWIPIVGFLFLCIAVSVAMVKDGWDGSPDRLDEFNEVFSQWYHWASRNLLAALIMTLVCTYARTRLFYIY